MGGGGGGGNKNLVGGGCLLGTWFPAGVENIGGALQNLMGGLSQYVGGACEGLKILSKNTCEGIHLIVKLPAISLQACKFTKINFITHIFQGFLLDFKLFFIVLFLGIISWKGASLFSGGGGGGLFFRWGGLHF